MIALTHDAVTELNQRACTHLAANGRLGETVAQIEDTDTEYAIDDTVVCLRNDRRLGVRNGDLATVIGATTDGVVIERGGDRFELPTGYLADADGSPAVPVRAMARTSAEPAANDLAGTTVSRPGSPAR